MELDQFAPSCLAIAAVMQHALELLIHLIDSFAESRSAHGRVTLRRCAALMAAKSCGVSERKQA